MNILTRLLPLILISPLSGQVQINEIMAKNTTVHPDIVDFEDYPDWIELHNTGATSASLDDHFLSDDLEEPFKWLIPSGTSIAPGEYLIIWADGYDAAPGEVHPRGYWPWDDFTTEGYHSNFNISSGGESVVLTKAEGVTTTPIIQATGAVWKFLDDGSDQSTQWRARTFDDSTWSSGASRLGYGNDGEATTVSFGDSSSNKHITTYFRHTFNVTDPTLFIALTMDLIVDDGAVVYINGNEVFRKNLPTTDITSQTLANVTVGGSDETTFTQHTLSASDLVAGANVIAVEVHQTDTDSSDISLDLGLSARSLTSSTTLDSVTFGEQLDDAAYGRDPADPSTWASLVKSTPGTENTGATIPDLRFESPDVTISPAGGFYPSAQTVSLSTTAGEIRYTIDGTIPRADSILYTAPFSVTANTPVRARAFETGKVPGVVATHSYFISETASNLPVVSLSLDNNTLFGNRIGIYTNTHEPTHSGIVNVYKGKDAPTSLEYFKSDGTLAFSVNGGVRIGGENNWRNAQKSLNFYTRGKYGDDPVAYHLFPGTSLAHFESFTLRNGGDDWTKSMLRDAMLPGIIGSQIALDASHYQPVVVYINGSYWGIHNLRSRNDDTWFTEKHHVIPDKLDYLGYAHHTSSSTTLGAFEGNTDDFIDLLSFLDNNDLTEPTIWSTVESRIDIDNFIDFIAVETYVINTSWRHNREFWRERKAGAKWRWFLPDIDRGLDLGNINSSGELDELIDEDPVLSRLITNQDFKNRLAQRIMAHRASTFAPARMIGIISEMDTQLTSEIDRHITRWNPEGGFSSSTRNSEIQEIKDFATQREATLITELKTQLSLPDPINLTLATDNAAAGKFFLNGVPVTPDVIAIFQNIDFDLTVEALPGYTFTGWTGATGGSTLDLNLATATTLTAHFVASSETLITSPLTTNINIPAGDIATFSGDLIIPSGFSLSLGSGSQLLVPVGKNIRVQGALNVSGSTEAPVVIAGRNGAQWGGISFEETTVTSTLSHLVISQANKGYEPTRYIAAISALNSTLVLDHLTITECGLPIFARGGSTTLLNSTLYTPHTGDCINVKGGYAETRNCIFLGNNVPDTDAIDYDSVDNGIIANNRIYRFQGSNSDGIDVGEECQNLLIEENLIYYNSDKGISVGQGSTIIARKNLIVGCTLGIGIKDASSHADIDQNTFVKNDIGIDIYEKNFGGGGGSATITNTIFSKSGTTALQIDSLSSGTINYSLSDTTAFSGNGNILADPEFVDPSILNFQLQINSPAINAGDPAHSLDPDNTRADIGALYTYSVLDYPYSLENSVVIQEVMANSGSTQPDWIELYNRSSAAVDISGWFLSDSASDLQKYRIPANTIIQPGQHLVFYEDLQFGTASIDPGRIVPFAFSDDGETAYLSSAVNDELTDYRYNESFGASLTGTSLGFYYKPSSDSYNFIPLSYPTPGTTNSSPLIGPIVISEIMFEPAGSGSSEYMELLNISDESVTLYDNTHLAAWRITNGIEYEFPSNAPITIAPGARIILTQSITEFNANFTVPSGTEILEWTSGKISNSGETLQLSRPAAVDALNILQYARVDRVNYEASTPWPTNTSGTGLALARIVESDYGNDFANWFSAQATPGSATNGVSFATWIASSTVAPEYRSEDDDPDGDQLSNSLEYALGTNPAVANTSPPYSVSFNGDYTVIDWQIPLDRPTGNLTLEYSPDLSADSWSIMPGSPLYYSTSTQSRRVIMPKGNQGFFRIGSVPQN
ncbi:MAG: lamin tail domain-containing protein [Luteolibacter sp.]